MFGNLWTEGPREEACHQCAQMDSGDGCACDYTSIPALSRSQPQASNPWGGFCKPNTLAQRIFLVNHAIDRVCETVGLEDRSERDVSSVRLTNLALCNRYLHDLNQSFTDTSPSSEPGFTDLTDLDFELAFKRADDDTLERSGNPSPRREAHAAKEHVASMDEWWHSTRDLETDAQELGLLADEIAAQVRELEPRPEMYSTYHSSFVQDWSHLTDDCDPNLEDDLAPKKANHLSWSHVMFNYRVKAIFLSYPMVLWAPYLDACKLERPTYDLGKQPPEIFEARDVNTKSVISQHHMLNHMLCRIDERRCHKSRTLLDSISITHLFR